MRIVLDTNDHHFNLLRLKKTFPTVEIIKLQNFLELIQKK